MAIEAKIDFMRQLEGRLTDVLTVAVLGTVMTVLNDVMQNYEMRSVEPWTEGKDDLLESYLTAMKVECKSPKTIKRYGYVIRRMMKVVNVPTRRITVYHLRSYLQREKERGLSNSTIRGIRDIFNTYFNWLQRESLIERNPCANLGAVKVPKKKRKAFSDADIEKLTRGCKTLRDRAIVHFLLSTGCRISEVTELN